MNSKLANLSLDFVAHDDLRSSLENDLLEMDSALSGNSYKAAVVLSGSVVEALVIDTLIASGILLEAEALKLELAPALQAALQAKLITQRCFDLSTVVRNYRNLIHPGRVVRLSERVTEETASVATSLTKIIIDELRLSREKAGGLTGVQIVEKLVRDSAAISIISHLLNDVPSRELHRLATELLPSAYEKEEDAEEFRDEATMAAICKCFFAVFEKCDEAGKSKIRKWFYDLYKTGGALKIIGYGTHFLQVRFLDKANTAESSLIVSHLLARFDENSEEILGCLEGIHDFLRPDDVLVFSDPIVKLAASGNKSASTLLRNTLVKTTGVTKNKLEKRLETWRDFYNKKNQRANATIVAEIIDWADIPF